MAQWTRHLTTNQGIAGSSPARIKLFLQRYLEIWDTTVEAVIAQKALIFLSSTLSAIPAHIHKLKQEGWPLWVYLNLNESVLPNFTLDSFFILKAWKVKQQSYWQTKGIDRDRTRTCNPQIRSLVPYPLGHTVSVSIECHQWGLVLLPSTPCCNNLRAKTIKSVKIALNSRLIWNN